ncbi:helix-turn-helix domain-containing protein [Enterococcus faecium]|uniref:helix-turn-helix domain-containing protein n=1 Tax=Enterococcus faecium TaxID=1352 RepID=UPI0039A58584
MGVSDASVNKYEKSTMKPKIDKLEKMAEIFGVSVAYITCSNTTQNENEITIAINEYERLKAIEQKYNEIKSLVAD